ncbi:MAG: DUF933 domain-containing protein [bacterium]|nr:DUF933 domain-containing protein [bacterium]
MKIGFIGVDIEEGKVKYKDENLIALEKKDNPKKLTPYFAEFIKDEFVHSDAIAVKKENILDVLILDIEKLENRLENSPEPAEEVLIKKCIEYLEDEKPLCDIKFSEDEKEILKQLAPHSYKGIVLLDGGENINDIIKMALEKSGHMFFYTSGPKESHAWLVKKNSTILACAAKIHSDLARGFIKGDVVAFDDYLKCHNFNDCKSKGLAKLVNRDYIVEPNDIIEIRFNV